MIDVSVFEPDVQEAARSLAVVPDIHPEDFIFQFLVENPSFQSTKDAVNYYFSDGRKSAEKFESLVTDYLGSRSGRSSFWSLPRASGACRVTWRGLRHSL
jgi:hypothetical protein